MRFISKSWTPLSLTILVLAGLWIWFSAVDSEKMASADIAAPQEGFNAPEFRLETLSGDEISLADLHGSPVVVNFWASWCPPCRSEMPAIQNVYTKYKPQGLRVLAVNLTHQDRLPEVSAFVQENKLTFPILLDQDGRVSSRYQTHSLPTTFFIDGNGIIQHVVIGGPMREPLIINRVESLFQE